MSAHAVPRSPEHCAKLAAITSAKWAAGVFNLAAMREAAQSRVVKFDAEMRAVAVRRYWQGRDMDMIADEVGVSRCVLRRELRSLGLGNRRLIPGFYRKAAA